uniref:Uncharacterized protein LOC104242006 n=1 Tax=Nicotiana sylvestris TaxID=4096 RepID=A0A1U7Y047_NICSY|nr:PREDICTED: uncharacterized protein LOC104242006 [Nicotiana sylvestris]
MEPAIYRKSECPIFAEIVPERARTSIYALDRSFESILASFAPPAVGILAQHVYGFKPIPKDSTGSQEIKTDRENAAPLAKALYTAIGIPMAICCFICSFLYCTYPRDRDRAKMDALIDTELQWIDEIGHHPPEEENVKLHFFESDELHGKEVTAIDIDYEVEEILDNDENDEKRLLQNQLKSSDSSKLKSKWNSKFYEYRIQLSD